MQSFSVDEAVRLGNQPDEGVMLCFQGRARACDDTDCTMALVWSPDLFLGELGRTCVYAVALPGEWDRGTVGQLNYAAPRLGRVDMSVEKVTT